MRHKIYLVARHEFVETVRTRSFWISILAIPLIIALGVLVPILLSRAKEARRYAVLDRSGFLLEAVEKRILRQDLEKVLAAAAALHRRDGRAFERLSGVLRQAALIFEGLGEAQRRSFVEVLSGRRSTVGAALPEKARRGVVGLPVGMRRWWRRAAAAELDELEVELSRRRFVRLEAPPGRVDTLAAFHDMLERGELFAYFVIGADPVASAAGCKYVSNNLTDRDLLNWFGGLASAEVRQRRLGRAGIGPQRARWLQEGLRFEDLRVGESDAEKEVESADAVRQWAPVAFVYLLWFAVFTRAQALLTDMIEEKASRIVEVLLSSVSPFQLMAGKILGVAASGLTVVGTWLCFLIVPLAVAPAAVGAPEAALSQIAADPLYVFSFVFYFLLGYLFYAAVLVGIGSVCNSVREAQNLMLPVLIPMLVPLFAMIPIGQDPNGWLARLLSFVPFFTPFVMMNRAAGPPAPWEYALTLALMAASIWVAVWGAARIFRIGILMTGKPPRLGEIVRWLRAGEGAAPLAEKSCSRSGAASTPGRPGAEA